MNFIASPELVTAFALAGRLSFNPVKDTLTGGDGNPTSCDCVFAVIAVAGVLILGSWQASATPANGVALIHAIQKAEPVASYHIPKYRRCRIVGRRRRRLGRYGHCVPSWYG
jgi:hypothetical protein